MRSLASTTRLATSRLALALVLAAGAASTAQEPDGADADAGVERLEERDAEWERAVRLAEEGELDEAIAAGRRVQTIERQTLGPAHDETVGTAVWLFEQLWFNNDLDGALAEAQSLRDAVTAAPPI